MDDKRLTATKYIWGTLGVLLLSLMAALAATRGELTASGSILVGLLIIAASASTIAIWRAPIVNDSEQREKAKRGERLMRLVNDLDEDEVYALSDLLADQHARLRDDVPQRRTRG